MKVWMCDGLNINLDEKEKLADDFSLRIIELEKYLRESRKEYRISDQIFRSGTSVGAHISEAKYAESNADFIHKLAGAQKEGNETLYWLRLLYRSEYLDKDLFLSLYSDCSQIMSILRKIILSVKSKNNK